MILKGKKETFGEVIWKNQHSKKLGKAMRSDQESSFKEPTRYDPGRQTETEQLNLATKKYAIHMLK